MLTAMANGQIKGAGNADKGTRIGYMNQFGGVQVMGEFMAKRSVVVMFLFEGLVSIWIGGCQLLAATLQRLQERKIRDLQSISDDVRFRAVMVLGEIGSEDAVPALVQALQQNLGLGFSGHLVWALKRIGTLEALKAAEEHKKSRIMRGY